MKKFLLISLMLSCALASCESDTTEATGTTNTSLSIGLEDVSQTILSKSNNEIKIILPATLKESDIMAITAEVVSSSGTTGASVTTKSGVSQSTWGVEINLPTYDSNGANNNDATIALTPPANAVTEMNAVVKLTGVVTVDLIDAEGVEHSSSSSFSYDADGDEDGYMLNLFSSMYYPDCDTWIINDYEVSSNEVNYELSSALESAQSSGRDIKVVYQNITNISSELMYGLSGLFTSLSFPQAQSVGRYSIYGCSNLTNIDLPMVTILANESFSNCASLTSVLLPQVVAIGDNSFCNCENLADISIPKVKVIGGGSFQGCDKIENIIVNDDYFTFEDNALYNQDKSVLYMMVSSYSGESYTAPANLKEIKDSVFSGQENLKYVNLSNVEVVGYRAFANCSNIAQVTALVATTFRTYAFISCTNLTQFTAPSATTFENDVFLMCDKIETIEAATSDGAKLSSGVFWGGGTSYDASGIALIIGAINSEYVTNNTLTVNEVSTTFSSITLK